MLQVFYTGVAKVDQDIAYVVMLGQVCCKRLSPMFHHFSSVRCKCVYLNGAYVSHICCKCFIWMLHMFCNGFSRVFSGVFTSVSDACFKCFICFQTYVASVIFGCFQSRSSVASPSSPSAASPRYLLVLSTSAGHPN